MLLFGQLLASEFWLSLEKHSKKLALIIYTAFQPQIQLLVF